MIYPRGNKKTGTRTEREVEACPRHDMAAPAITGVREMGAASPRRRFATHTWRHRH